MDVGLAALLCGSHQQSARHAAAGVHVMGVGRWRVPSSMPTVSKTNGCDESVTVSQGRSRALNARGRGDQHLHARKGIDRPPLDRAWKVG